MDKINKPFLYTLLVAILLFASNILFLHLWWTKPCDCSGKTVIEWRDSTAPNKEAEKTIINSKPKLIGVKKYINGGTHKGVEFDTVKSLNPSNSRELESNMVELNQVSTCLDTTIYKLDTLSPENFRATATATVTNNELINLKVDYKNLAPEKWRIETITKTVVQEEKKSLVKVYLGVHVGTTIVNKTLGTYRGGGDIDAIIADRHMLGINGGVNSMLQPEVGIRFSEKISFKKK